MLKKKSGGTIGILGDYTGLTAELKYNQLSTFTVEYPAYINGVSAPFYEDLVGDRLLQIDPYGVFVLDGPESKGSGLNEKKVCTCYSLEYELTGKSIMLESGTYKFYNLINPSDPATVLGRVLEKARNWRIGAVSKTLWNRYRTFDDTDTKVYPFMSDTLQTSYGCVFGFDTYTRTINVLDADADVTMVPVYLSYDNLIKEGTIKEVNDNMFTMLSIYGAAPLTIRDVNPIGSNYIYNLDYYIGIGDIPAALAAKWNDWKALIKSRQQYFSSLVALRNAAYSRYLTAKSKLADLEGELASLDNLRSVCVQGRATAKNQSAIDYYDKRLAEIASQCSSKEDEIEEQQEEVEKLKGDYSTIGEDISNVANELSISTYFSADELKTLDHYLSEDSLVDSTFAVFDVDVSNDEDSFTDIVKAKVGFDDISLVDVQMTGVWACNKCHRHFLAASTPSKCPHCSSTGVHSIETSGQRLFSISGGNISISGTYRKLDQEGNTVTSAYSLASSIVKGTVDHRADGELVCSFYLGSGVANGVSFPSGNLTIASSSNFNNNTFLTGFEKVVETISDDETGASYEDVHYEGGSSFSIGDGSAYFTRNVTDSQRYYVAQELYDHATKCLEDISTPTYSFELSTINPIFAKEFEPFKDALRFGCGCYLQLRDDLLTKQMLLEIHLDFDNPSKSQMIFSNGFKRPDKVNTMKKQLEESRAASRTLDYKRHEYGDPGGVYDAATAFLADGLNAAKAQIIGGPNQNVIIDGRGIKIASVEGKEYFMLTNGMIAIIDADGNAKMAMGHFYNTTTGQDYYGVLADVIAGDLLIGVQLNITCPDINGGVAQFKVDKSGAFLNNSRFYLQNDRGGKIGMDANYGIFAGLSSLFTTTDTNHVTLSFIDDNGDVIFDGDGFPRDTNFWVDIRTGYIYLRGKVIAESGWFRGIVQASDYQDLSGKSMLTSDGKFKSSVLDLGNIFLDGTTGDISMSGNLNLSGLSKITWGDMSPTKYQFSTSLSGPWHGTQKTNDKYRRDSTDGGTTWGVAYQFVGKDGQDGVDGSDADVPNYVRINGLDFTAMTSSYIKSPRIFTNWLSVMPIDFDGSLADSIGYNGIRFDEGFRMFGSFMGGDHEYLAIAPYDAGTNPTVAFFSPQGSYAEWLFEQTIFHNPVRFTGDVEFEGETKGVHSYFA